MRAAVFEAFQGPIRIQNVPRSGTGAGRRRHRAEGQRHLPQRLARLDGPRFRRGAAARAGARTGGRGRRRGPRRAALETGRPGHGAVRRRLRSLPAVRERQPSGLRPPVPARIHGVGVVRRVRRHRTGRRQSGAPARCHGFRRGRRPGLPLHHRVPRRGRTGPRGRRGMGVGAGVRRGRPVGSDDRPRRGRPRDRGRRAARGPGLRRRTGRRRASRRAGHQRRGRSPDRNLQGRHTCFHRRARQPGNLPQRHPGTADTRPATYRRA